MASSSANEEDEQKSPDEHEQELTTEDHLQRKRTRVGSQLDNDSETKVNNETITTDDKEKSATPEENSETAMNTKTSVSKRRKLNVDREEETNDSVPSTTTTTNTESKQPSTSTSTATDEDEDEDDDDDDDDVDEDDDEDEEEEDDTNEPLNLPPTTNLYLHLRQRELGVFHRTRERTTCRAFHNNIIGSRNLVQRMKISHTLDGHNGCVNALAFNRTGTHDFHKRFQRISL